MTHNFSASTTNKVFGCYVTVRWKAKIFIVNNCCFNFFRSNISSVANMYSQPNNNLVRHSADAAILLVKQYSRRNSCGVAFPFTCKLLNLIPHPCAQVAYFNGMATGRTFGTVRKGCALGYFRYSNIFAAVKGHKTCLYMF